MQIEMKKIVFIVSALNRTGLTSILVNTAVRLDKNKFYPTIVTLGGRSIGGYEDYCRDNGVNVINADVSRYGCFLFPKRVMNIIDEISPEIVHAHCLRSYVFCALYMKKYIRVMTVHSIVKYNFRYEFGALKGGILDKIVDVCIRRYDKCIGVAECIKNFYRNQKNIDIDFVVNGINLDRFIFSGDDRSELRSRYNINEDERLFIYTGSISERKNVERLLNIFYHNGGKLIILGDGPLFARFQRQYDSVDNIIFCGRVDNISSYLSAADVFISLSRSEGMPNSVIEAMACGLPCILSNIPSHMELYSGYFDRIMMLEESESFEVSDPGINAFFRKNFRDADGKNTSIIRSRFSHGRMADEYTEKYISLLSDSSY